MKSVGQLNSAFGQSIGWGMAMLLILSGCANNYNPYQQYAYPQSYMQHHLCRISFTPSAIERTN
jgi:hypothetical protein